MVGPHPGRCALERRRRLRLPADGLTVRFQRQHVGTSFLTPVTGWVDSMDNSYLGSPWAAEVTGDFAAVSLVPGDVRDVRGLHALHDDHAASR